MKTHKVIDLTYHEDEGNSVYAGTQEECYDFIAEQGSITSMYRVVPMTTQEMEMNNRTMEKEYMVYDVATAGQAIIGTWEECNAFISENRWSGIAITTNEIMTIGETYPSDLSRMLSLYAAVGIYINFGYDAYKLLESGDEPGDVCIRTTINYRCDGEWKYNDAGCFRDFDDARDAALWSAADLVVNGYGINKI
jgi:hypothetical protein